MNGLFGRDSLYTLLWAVQLGCAALLTPVTTRLLGADQFGLTATANTLMQVLFVLAALGLHVAVQRQYERPGGPRDARRVLGAALMLAVAVGAVAWASIPAWAAALGLGASTGLLRAVVVWAVTSAVTAVALALLRSRDRLGAFASVSLLQSVVAEAASLCLISRYGATAAHFVLGQLAAQGAALALALLLAPPLPVRVRDLPLVRDALRFSLPLVPAVLGTFVLSMADRLVVQSELGATPVVRYQVAYNVASAPLLLLSLMYAAWMPRFFAGDGTAVVAAARDALYRLLGPVLTGFSLLAPLVLRVWAPASYRPGELTWVVLPIVLTAVPFAAQLALGQALTVRGRTGWVALGTLAAAVANVVLNLWLVPVWGIAGSALATLLAYVLLASMLSVCVRRYAPVPRPSWRGRALLALSAAAATVVPVLPSGGVAGVGIRLGLALLAGVWGLSVLAGLRRSPAGADPVRADRSSMRRAGVSA